MANSNEKYSVKMSGYLEKKGKLKMVSSWKSLWFVLEGRLLLYYRSKDEYDALSPCKGSINLGPSCSVEPLLGTSCVFQIQTRANTIVLKARTRLEQHKWMQAIVAALNHNYNANRMLHFRYSSDDLVPRRTIENRSSLSRQYTLPSDRFKMEKRHTFCRSFETLQGGVQCRPKSTIIPRNDSVMIENAEYCTKGPSDTLRVPTVFKQVETALKKSTSSKDKLSQEIWESQDQEEYYAISAPTTAEREFLRKRSQEKNDHIYERISGESRHSKEVILDNDVYTTVDEVNEALLKCAKNDKDQVNVDNDIYNRVDNDEEAQIENDQYCTPDIIIGDTDLVSYHEYNLPNRDNHIYSTPNFDHNENRISRQEDTEVNPYAMCHIYPKSSRFSVDSPSNTDYDAIYDNPIEYTGAPASRQSLGHVGKLLRKFRKIATNSDAEKGPDIPKKMGFLKKLFRRVPEKKKEREPPEVVEEIEYAQIDEEVVSKMDIAYCVDKKLLAELEMILQLKRQKLEDYLEDAKASSKDLDDSISISKCKQQTSTSGTIAKPKITAKPQKSNAALSVEDERYKNLKTIDEILDDLEQMKKTDTVTSGKVRCLIEKFDQNIKKTDATLLYASSDSLSDVVLRSINETSRNTNTHNSNDELNLLLCELAKVTNAPILTPGVTTSLGASSNPKDEEFLNLLSKSQRRYSDPDYDTPRPHSNLQITKNKETDEDALTATRFFGPAMPNYENRERESSFPFASISPDSLEIETASASNNNDGNMASYSSHKYKNCNEAKTRIKRDEEEEVFIDSLEPYNQDCL